MLEGANRCMFNFGRAHGYDGDLMGQQISLFSETHLVIELVFNNSVCVPFIEAYGRKTVMHILGGVLACKMFNGNSAT